MYVLNNIFFSMDLHQRKSTLKSTFFILKFYNHSDPQQATKTVESDMVVVVHTCDPLRRSGEEDGEFQASLC